MCGMHYPEDLIADTEWLWVLERSSCSKDLSPIQHCKGDGVGVFGFFVGGGIQIKT